jgi:diguanylate cyclase (GGDEF)-like protein
MFNPIRPDALWSMILGLLLTAGIWAAIILENDHGLQIDLKNAKISVANLATVFEKHVSESVALIDLSILHLRDNFELKGRTDERFMQHILTRVLPGSILNISILDRTGRLTYSSALHASPGQQDFSDREYFQRQRDAQSDELYISKPVQDRSTNRWVIQCVRTLHKQGRFDGVVLFSLDAMHFVDLHSDVDVGTEGAINLVGMDRVIRARVSHVASRNSFFGQIMPSERPFFDPKQVPHGIYLAHSSIDGVERIGAWRRLSNAPLVVLVLLSKSEVLASHRDREINSYWLGIVLSLIILGGAVLIGALLTKNAETREALEKLATTDALTGIANRRHFYTRIADEFERTRRYRRPLSIIMFDIDFFKRVNDIYGHAAGDEVLRAISTQCARAIRKHDLLGRVGGEEFCILLPETTEEAAVTVAEGLRAILARECISVKQGQTIIVTASFGVASLTLRDETFESLLSRADTALYAAKDAGRNRVQAHSQLRAQKLSCSSALQAAV